MKYIVVLGIGILIGALGEYLYQLKNDAQKSTNDDSVELAEKGKKGKDLAKDKNLSKAKSQPSNIKNPKKLENESGIENDSQIVKVEENFTLPGEDTINYYDTILSASDSQFISFAKDNFEDTSTAAITVDTTLNNDTIEIEEPLVVKKEEVLGMVTLPIIKLSNDTSSLNSSDSILSKLSSINEKAIDQINVSFWSSPINFRGYKFYGNKLILYGLPYSPEVKQKARIYEFQNTYFFSNGGKIYKIKNTLDYKTYEQVLDTTILKVFK